MLFVLACGFAKSLLLLIKGGLRRELVAFEDGVFIVATSWTILGFILSS